ncbi:hypothetical protein BDA96_01G281100 [Sorghum bicolor]|uniref:Cation-transporting P-type ATPase N-terminal domain-containing protein n=1 Tax=Sorghum bicolor TaxID=4558 RepID=A0A921V1J8_SORBI|nr:hypothetical protein BDA96_01G281100 [Sorghum bicolor]
MAAATRGHGEAEARGGGSPLWCSGGAGGGARTPVVLRGSPPDPPRARRRHEDSDEETERPPLDPSSRRSDLAILCGGGASSTQPRRSIAASSRLATSLTAGRSHVITDVASDKSIQYKFHYHNDELCAVAFMDDHYHEKLRVAVLVSKAALQFINSIAPSSEYKVPADVKAAGFGICAEELSSIVEGHDVKKLKSHGGVQGLASKLSTSESDGLATSADKLSTRRGVFGVNNFAEAESRGFLVFVWEALQDMTLMILAVCAFVSLMVGIATEGWPKGAHDGLGIVASILLVVFVTASSDYRQSLQFKDLDKEKKKITVQVTRSGYRQKLSIYELLAGDLVHLSIGDQVPADGLFMSGFSLLINESSLTGESEPVAVNAENPFLLSGTTVQDGSCKMLVTTVGMRTQWGKLMATLSEGGDDETPLQVKLNGVATIIGKIGLIFAVITFAVLTESLFPCKIMDGTYLSWTGDDALELLESSMLFGTIVRSIMDKQ